MITVGMDDINIHLHGRISAKLGLGISENPYVEGAILAEEYASVLWLDGYNEGINDEGEVEHVVYA